VHKVIYAKIIIAPAAAVFRSSFVGQLPENLRTIHKLPMFPTHINDISVMIPHIMPSLHCRHNPDSHSQNTLRICIADVSTEHR
jgi:hypothetical protein